MSSSRPGPTEGEPVGSSWFRCLVLVVAGLASATGCGADDGPDRAEAVVGVRGEACGATSRGVGVVVGDGRVLTNAHVVAGIDAIEVDGREGVLVGFDANRDLALITVSGLGRPGIELGSVEAGDEGTLVAIDATDSYVRHPFRVRRRIRATGEDIYRDAGADRRALEVEVEFAPGWSGAGLFDDQGRLVGVAFAESRRTRGVTYAVAESEIRDFLGSVDDDPADSGPCL